MLAGADIEQAEDEEALDYEHEAPRSTYFADLADDSSDDTDDDEITGSAPGTPPDSHSSRQPSRDLDSAPPSRSPSRSPSVESIQRPMPRGPAQPLQLALGLWLERSGADLAVDKPIEFYHSRCWASSNLSTSGEFARSTQGKLIMVGDIVSSSHISAQVIIDEEHKNHR